MFADCQNFAGSWRGYFVGKWFRTVFLYCKKIHYVVLVFFFSFYCIIKDGYKIHDNIENVNSIIIIFTMIIAIIIVRIRVIIVYVLIMVDIMVSYSIVDNI